MLDDEDSGLRLLVTIVVRVGVEVGGGYDEVEESLVPTGSTEDWYEGVMVEVGGLGLLLVVMVVEVWEEGGG